MAKKSKISIDYEQVSCDSGDEEQERRPKSRQQRQPLLSPSQTASTSISIVANEGPQQLNTTESTNVEQIIEMEKQQSHDGDRNVANNWDKFCLLMWKNGLLQWRHKIQTIVEILVPVGFSVIIILIRSIVDPDIFPDPLHYEPYAINTLQPLNETAQQKSQMIKDWKLVYSPKNEVLETLLTGAATSLGLKGVYGVAGQKELEATMVNKQLVAGVQFEHSPNLTELPKNLMYSLRFPAESRTPPAQLANPLIFNWRTNLLFPIFSTGGPRGREDNDGGMVWYFREGFIPVQDAIARSFTKMTCVGRPCENEELPDIWMQRFPYPPFTLDVLLQGLETVVSFFILLSFIYPCINTVRFIAIEKEKQLKEAMKIMGLPNWLHWTSWFIRTMLFMIVSISCIVCLLKISMYDNSVSVFTYSDWTAIWVFLFVYSISMTTFCFMLSVFFSKANTAAAVAGLVWFLLYVPFSFTQQNYEQLSLGTKMTVCLSSNTAMAYGFYMILRFEGIGEGLQWSNFWRPVTVDDNITVGMTMLFMLLTSFIYLLITLYVEKVMPGNYGVPEKWYFPFTKEFWFGLPEYTGVDDSSEASNGYSNEKRNHLNFEADPKNRRAGIRVKNLRKIYENKKVAVKGLSVNMYDDQITVLLGHNGAGKTTTMSMLTGMFPPTSGTALINGHDIRTNLQRARSSIGLCPQHNILFDELTVREHIIFYSRLKGLDPKAIDEEVTKYVRLLELEPKINAMSASLSGGMKRKLSVGVALCGGSKVILLDEPSSGMDPAARRALWDLLQVEKRGRTILLSTHFMDEADILGDRIAIMAEGELKCCGTSFFLKKRFGTGYHLVCVKNEDCDSSLVTDILREYIPNIQVETEIGSELSYELPDDSVGIFEKMFKYLEASQEELKLGSFGVSLTTLEEVFLKVGSDSMRLAPQTNGATTQNGEINGNHNGYTHQTNLENGVFTTNASSSGSFVLLRGFSLRRNQYIAMFKKRFIYWLRSWVLFLLQNLIPITFVVISVLVVRAMEKQTKLPPLEMSLSVYDKTVTMLHDSKPNSNDTIERILWQYREDFKSQPTRARLDLVSTDIQEYFLKMAETHLVRLNSQYLVAISRNDSENNQLIAWYNNQPFHTAPLSINMVHNAMLHSLVGSDHNIRVFNKPLPFTFDSRISMLMAGNNMGFQLATNISFAMAFVSAFYVMFYIKERESKAKLLQFVSGVNVSTFWTTSFVFDFLTYVLTSVLLLLTLAAFQEEGWSTLLEMSRVLSIMILFGFAMLPMTFIASLLFQVPSSGFVRMTIIYIFTGITVFFVIVAMSYPAFKLAHTADTLKWIFLVFPHYSLSSSLNNLNFVGTTDRVCRQLCEQIPLCTKDFLCKFKKECCDTSYYAWKEPGIGRNLVYMGATGVIGFIILLIIEYRIFNGIIYAIRDCFNKPLPVESEETVVDDDVSEEKRRVDEMSPAELESNNLVLQRLTKYYGSFLAVNQLSIGIKHSECFGLLGINGAGKTTTFKMLTGDEKISDGDGWVRGISLKNSMPEVHKIIGYCPQFDALIEDLTGRETLEMFALLRGVPPKEINALSVRLATDLNFMKHIDKQVFEYSGGNKRKLSTAIALIGNPVVVYLDEPTTGMDPGARRNLWDMVCKQRNSGKSIVLTSHSMEECEALCTRLAIMVNGEFKCLGSTQHLKSKFSKGFVLTVKVHKNTEFDIDLRDDNSNLPTEVRLKILRIKEFILQSFPGAYLKEEYQGLLVYFVPPTSAIKWSSMFGIMETGKQTLEIEDYSISQTSLEQVFLSFTKNQRDETRGGQSANR